MRQLGPHNQSSVANQPASAAAPQELARMANDCNPALALDPTFILMLSVRRPTRVRPRRQEGLCKSSPPSLRR
jgi:hypothetical protein